MSAKKDKKPLTATTMRIVLFSVLALILLGMGGGFYFAYSKLQQTAEDVAETQSAAEESDKKLQRLVSLEAKLKEHESTVQKAKQVVADSKSYQYQNQIVADLTGYARRSGVSIDSFVFQDAPAASSSAPSQPPSGTSEAGGGSAPATSAPASAASSIKSTFVSVQIGKDTPYRNLLNFINNIEQNLTRMQIAELTLSKGEGRNTIAAQTLNIEVYIK